MAFPFFVFSDIIPSKGGIEVKTIHVNGKAIEPVRQSDGSWTVITRGYEEDIPDLGRQELICNACGFPTYPKCKKECKAWMPQPLEQQY